MTLAEAAHARRGLVARIGVAARGAVRETPAWIGIGSVGRRVRGRPAVGHRRVVAETAVARGLVVELDQERATRAAGDERSQQRAQAARPNVAHAPAYHARWHGTQPTRACSDIAMSLVMRSAVRAGAITTTQAGSR